MINAKIGNLSPVFSLKNQNNETINLKDFRDKNQVIVYFYPRAMTPGCTTQAQGLRDFAKVYADKNTIILGISPDLPEKLKKFEIKEKLNFDLLSDPEHEIADKYGAWGKKKFMGKEYHGILRYTYIIGIDGRLKHIIDNVKTKTHHKDVCPFLED